MPTAALINGKTTPAELSRAARDRAEQVADLVDQFCDEWIDNEDDAIGFAELAFRIIGDLTLEQLPTISRGSAGHWAAGVIHTLARVNDMFDPAHPLHLKSAGIAEFFGVERNGPKDRADDIARLLGITNDDPRLRLDTILNELEDEAHAATSYFDGLELPDGRLPDGSTVRDTVFPDLAVGSQHELRPGEQVILIRDLQRLIPDDMLHALAEIVPFYSIPRAGHRATSLVAADFEADDLDEVDALDEHEADLLFNAPAGPRALAPLSTDAPPTAKPAPASKPKRRGGTRKPKKH